VKERKINKTTGEASCLTTKTTGEASCLTTRLEASPIEASPVDFLISGLYKAGF